MRDRIRHPAVPSFPPKRRSSPSPSLLAAFSLLAALGASAHADGLVFVVNTAADLPDASLATPEADADPATPGDQTTLRAAVMQANHEPGPDTIVLPAGVWKLTLKGAAEDAAALGDLDVTDDLTITGTPADPQTGSPGTIIDGGKLKDRLFDVTGGASLTLQGVTLRNGRAPTGESGGALRVASGSADLSQVIVSKCKSTANGGGIDMLANTGSLTLTDVFLQKNSATGNGGGIDVEAGQLHATSVTFQSCHAGGEGGGLAVTTSIASLTNSTFCVNSAGKNGGGIALINGSVLTVVNSTLSLNGCKAVTGIYADDFGPDLNGVNTWLLRNTLLDNKGARNCGLVRPISLGGNLDSGTSCGFPSGDQSGVKSLLLKLKNYGGFTPTCALKPTSPAIDAGTDNGAPPTDQRGVARVDVPDVGATFVATDCGAYEFVPPVP